MIQCPNCGQDVADDAVHCGHCGHKLQAGTGQKTMFGFAAVSPEEMRRAAEEAGVLRGAPNPDPPTGTAIPDPGSEVPTQAIETPHSDPTTIPTPAIPKPGDFRLPTPTGQGLSETSSSVFDLPKPGGDQPATINAQSVGPTPTDAPEPAWASTSDTDPNLAPQTHFPQPDPNFVADPTVDEATPTQPERQIATAAYPKNDPTFDMTPGPTGGALQKKGPPIALIAGVGVVLLFVLCIIGTAIGLMFM